MDGAPLMTTRNKGVLLSYATANKKKALSKRAYQGKKPHAAAGKTKTKVPTLWQQWRQRVKQQAEENEAPNKGR